jgi:hypothetical protein
LMSGTPHGRHTESVEKSQRRWRRSRGELGLLVGGTA